jgi:hypothetical protein
MDTDEPRLADPNTESELPKLPNARRLTVLPNSENERTDNDEPMFTKPNTDNEHPTRATERTEKLLPILA